MANELVTAKDLQEQYDNAEYRARRYGDSVSSAEYRMRAKHIERIDRAETDLNALTDALGWERSAMGRCRDIILDDASKLRPEMVKARRESAEKSGDAGLLHALMSQESGFLNRVWNAKIKAETELATLRAENARLKAPVSGLLGRYFITGGRQYRYIKQDITDLECLVDALIAARAKEKA